jgi:CheY-like chemotaxis protein/phosphoribosyl 1,2-cyclic phosphodiesterase
MTVIAPSKGRVLIADDVPDMLELTTRIVAGMGFEVIAVGDGEEALAKARSDRPDLIIIDIMMPKMHGIDVLKAVLSELPVGVIMASAKSFKPDVDQAMMLGAFAFITKPFKEQDLADAVERFFAQRSASRASPTSAAAAAAAYAPSLDLTGGYWKLWGTRGSIPVVGPQYARHGGNTSCLEISRGEEVILIDAGSGIRDVGMELVRGAPRHIRLLIGHTHWDHIQGFPFFAPAYVPGFRIDIYGAPGFGKDLESVFRGQLDRDYFPVEMQDMAADLSFHKLEENPCVFGDVRIGWEFMNHPGATVGFRIEAGSRRISYITDNEFLKGYLGRPHDIHKDDLHVGPFRKTIDFVAGADLLIGEAQYPNDEYPKKIGWGHSSVSNACVLAREAGVKRWIVTHHDPMHDDQALQRKLDLTRQILRDMGCDIDVTHAFDGMSQPL